MATKPAAICIIVENLPVPLDRRVWQEARALTAAGYHVSVICPKGRGLEKSRETLEGVEIYRHRLPQASSAFGYLFEYAWALTAEFWLALRIYARTRFRVLQACNPPDTIFLIGFFFKLFGVRFVFDHHDLNPELYLAKFQRRDFFYRLVCLAERLTFQTADVAIAANESFREIALARGHVLPERSWVVRSCPDLSICHPRPPLTGLKEGRKLLALYVGVMGAQDGVELLVKSIHYLVKEQGRSDTLFVLIGPGPEVDRLKALSTELGLDSVVKFTGPLFGEDLRSYLASADVGVAPDPANEFNNKLTQNKILEYMAYGLPTVAYDLPGAHRSAADAALYATGNNPIEFAKLLAKLLDSEALRRQLGDRGQQRIHQTLNWDIEKQEFLNAYRAVLQPKSAIPSSSKTK